MRAVYRAERMVPVTVGYRPDRACVRHPHLPELIAPVTTTMKDMKSVKKDVFFLLLSVFMPFMLFMVERIRCIWLLGSDLVRTP